MPTLLLERPPTPRNLPTVARPEAECNPPSDDSATQADPSPKTAREILADSDWAVLISRAMVLEFCNPQDFPAFLVYAAARALWDRGLRGRAPGGWPELLGMSQRSWYSAKLRAVALGLVRVVPGGGIEPLVRYEPGQGQYSRVPTSILFDENLSRTAKRVFIAQALYRSGLGDSRAAVATLARASSTHIRNVHRALRELENHCRIMRMGAVGRGVQRYNLVGQVIPKTAPKSTESYPHNPQAGTLPKGEIGNESHPTGPKSATRATPESATRATLSRVFKNKGSQERRAPTALADGPSPRDEKPPPTKMEAKAINCRYGLTAPGADFSKPASGLQGQQAKRVAEPPSKPPWRPLRTGRTLEKNWEADTLRLGGAGLFQTVKNAVPQLPRRKEIAK